MKNGPNTESSLPALRRRALWGRIAEGAALLALVGVVAGSAIVTKEVQAKGRLSALAALDGTVGGVGGAGTGVGEAARGADLTGEAEVEEEFPLADEEVLGEVEEEAEEAPSSARTALVPAGMEGNTELRWFNGRPVRPARTMWMTVTAYSPDERSCGKWANGKTASLHSVHTNGMKLVAADTRLLPMGSMLSVPGYDDGNIVPVLDRGGAIKGHRLDLLYPTHESARKWGVKRLKVTVWEYADGEPADDWRKIRDSKR